MNDLGARAYPAEELPLHRLVDPPAGRLEGWIARVADWCSPVLIKEVRQALKSRSFLITFMLLLLAAVIWSLLGMSLAGAGEFRSVGGMMLLGYLWILGFPLVIVVPLSAFRSMCREFEEDTLHLVSITTMSPRQLVVGKLLSALAQMVIYLSALAPCMAFTWLLRGVDMVGIGFALLLAVTGSAALSALGLFLGAISRNAVFRFVMTVILIGGLIFLYCMWCVLRVGVESGEISAVDIAIQMHVAFLVVFGTSGWLFLEAAAAAISFPADNRSTRPRVAMLVQSGLLAVMVLGVAGHSNAQFATMTDTAGWLPMMLLGTGMAACMYWLVMGSMLCGEPGRLSLRVRRSLPRTLPGRLGLTLLFPGGGRGYLFAITNMVGWCGGTILAALLIEGIIPVCLDGLSRGLSWSELVAESPDLERMFGSVLFGNGMRDGPDIGFPLLGLAYGVIYLSATYLFVRLFVALRVRVIPVAGLLTLVMVMVLGVLGGLIAELLRQRWLDRSFEPSILSLPNLFVVFGDAIEDGAGFWLALLTPLAAILLLGCLRFALPELLDDVVTVPQRVVEELEQPVEPRLERGEQIEEIFAARLGREAVDQTGESAGKLPKD
jgi:hypothetical protein